MKETGKEPGAKAPLRTAGAHGARKGSPTEIPGNGQPAAIGPVKRGRRFIKACAVPFIIIFAAFWLSVNVMCTGSRVSYGLYGKEKVWNPCVAGPGTDSLLRSKARLGDLIFVSDATESHTGSMEDAIAAATGNFTHVAIVLSPDTVIEATPLRGVAKRSMKDFCQENENKVLAVYCLQESICLDTAYLRSQAQALTGKDYDYYFLPDNDKYYCSELVQACFRHCDGSPLFRSSPMNFHASDGTLPAYWKHLFDSLQCPVPQGVDGTNPAFMSMDSSLERKK